MGLGLFIASLGGESRIKNKKTAHENAKPRVIGRRKATGPANTYSSGIAGLPEELRKLGYRVRVAQLFFCKM